MTPPWAHRELVTDRLVSAINAHDLDRAAGRLYLEDVERARIGMEETVETLSGQRPSAPLDRPGE
jgi:hypothetical protein